MKDRLEILNEYIKKEMELLGCSAEETTSYIRVNDFMDYRNVRVKQAWIAKITQGMDTKTVATERNNLDKERREKHNRALISMLGFDTVADALGLEPIYNGNKLTNEQIKNHDSSTYDTRKEMTDWFLGLLDDITDLSQLRESSTKQEKFISDLRDKTFKFDRDYGVEDTLHHDDDDVRFKDEKKDKFYENNER